MPTYRLDIEYRGPAFSGWQKQRGAATVQGALEDALRVIARVPVPVTGASRTDAGVHAVQQVAAIRLDSPMEPHRLMRGLNALCRPHIAVWRVTQVPDGFHPRFDAAGKHYLYRIVNRSAPPAIEAGLAWHVPQDLDTERMERAARHFVGEHDFSAFRAADCQMPSPVRRIDCVRVRTAPRDQVEIHVVGTAFLKNMVRIMVGTLVDIGLHRLEPDAVARGLEHKQRSRMGRTAPAHGLHLYKVLYPDDLPYAV